MDRSEEGMFINIIFKQLIRTKADISNFIK